MKPSIRKRPGAGTFLLILDEFHKGGSFEGIAKHFNTEKDLVEEVVRFALLLQQRMFHHVEHNEEF